MGQSAALKTGGLATKGFVIFARRYMRKLWREICPVC